MVLSANPFVVPELIGLEVVALVLSLWFWGIIGGTIAGVQGKTTSRGWWISFTVVHVVLWGGLLWLVWKGRRQDHRMTGIRRFRYPSL